MQYWVGITDNDWFDTLAQLSPDEVNFWQPGGSTSFKAILPGAPFLFKLHSPRFLNGTMPMCTKVRPCSVDYASCVCNHGE